MRYNHTMSSKKLKKAPSLQTIADETDGGTPKKLSRKPIVGKVSVKKEKPMLKSASVSGLTGGFIRISETHIQKVYR
jgi:hypothetical protein